MARRNSHGEHENHERWLVSYADFITLLFAFFVVMFASAKADTNRAQRVSESIKNAYTNSQVAAVVRAVMGGGKQGPREPEDAGAAGHAKTPSVSEAMAVELLPSLQILSKELNKEINRGEVQLHMEARGLVITLREMAFFPSGDDAISPEMFPTIAKIAEAIRKLPNAVRLEGHTDSVPVHGGRFATNWHLSAARSIAMLEILTAKFNIPVERLAVAGYADTMPVDTNATPEGRARNRRVDIVVFNDAALVREPKAAAGAPNSAPAPPLAGAKRAG